MFKHIIDKDLELRLICMEDSEEIFSLIDSNREHLREWLPWVDGTISVEDTKNFIKSSMNQYGANNGFQAGIWYMGKVVGIIGLHQLNFYHKNTSIGYWLAEEFQGKGIMTKACRAVIEHIFINLELERVEIRCADKNFKSQAIPERLGFTKEGVCRNVENLYGNYVNHIVFSVLREEWEKKEISI